MPDPRIEFVNSEKGGIWSESHGLSWEDAQRVNELAGWEMYRKVE